MTLADARDWMVLVVGALWIVRFCWRIADSYVQYRQNHPFG